MSINWTQVLVFAAVVLVVSILGIALLPFFLGGWGMMGPGMMGGWYPEYGGWMGRAFGWLFMLVAMALPLGMVILLILGLVWLVRGTSGPEAPRPAPPTVQTCPNCGQGVQADWQVCPYCGESLKSSH